MDLWGLWNEQLDSGGPEVLLETSGYLNVYQGIQRETLGWSSCYHIIYLLGERRDKLNVHPFFLFYSMVWICVSTQNLCIEILTPKGDGIGK